MKSIAGKEKKLTGPVSLPQKKKTLKQINIGWKQKGTEKI